MIIERGENLLLLSAKGDMMISRIKSRHSIPTRWIFGGDDTISHHYGHTERSPRSHGPSCEALEGRVVLSTWGGGGNNFLGSLASVGIVTGGDFGGPASTYYSPWASQNAQVAQLNSAVQRLQTELQSLAAKSHITIVDINNLTTDSQSIAGAGFWINPQNLQKSVSELVTAVASGAATTQAQTDFNALLSGSNVAQATIDKTFNDLVQTIQDSKITSADLSAVAADQAAVQSDLNNLPNGARGFGGYQTLLAGSGSLNSNLATSLSSAGVATLPAQAGGTQGLYAPSTASQNSQLTQLNTDIQKLQTENQTLAAKSLVTVSDLTDLVTDSQTIAGAGLRLDPQSLDKVVNELVTAVAAGTDTTQAQTDFNALFTGSNVAQTSIDKTFNDLVQTIQDSKVTAADLTTLAADQAAIQTDRTNLQNGSGTSVTNSTGSAGSGTSGSSGTTSSTGGTVTHFARLRGFRGFSRVRLR